MSTLPNLGSQVKLRLLKPPEPEPIKCIRCNGEGDWINSYDYVSSTGEACNWSFHEVCKLCHGTGDDDPLLEGIKRGELKPEVCPCPM